jgi:hypothetical protein
MNTPETTQKVSLGCGTLILIAVIVLIFGGSSSQSTTRTELREMKIEIQRLGNEIKELRAALEKNRL